MIPDTGFPRVGGMAKEGHRKRQLDHGANTSISYNTQAFGPRTSSWVIPLKHAFGAERVRSGSSRSRAVVEVVVHGS